MRGGRVLFFSFLICLPAVLLVSAGAWLIAANVPRAIRTAPSRIGREYREVAETLLEHPSLASGEGERRAGWRQNGKLDGRPWGYVVTNGTALVWHLTDGRRCRWIERPAIRPFPYALVFYWGGAVAGFLLFGLSALFVACFLAYMRERDDFLAATAHDLTTPLVGMRRMIGRDDEEVRRLNERMLLLVDNIKNFLKLGGRRKAPDLKSCDLVALCREAYALFAADYEDSEGGPVVFRAPHTSQTSLPCVQADEAMTLQILWNLFGNDLKYAAPYGKVEVRFSSEEARVRVEFADEGPGMSAWQRRKAFDRYYRAKTVLSSGKGGFGIGLCTAREFARAMGGDLTIRPNAPKGCVFELCLPKTPS